MPAMQGSGSKGSGADGQGSPDSDSHSDNAALRQELTRLWESALGSLKVLSADGDAFRSVSLDEVRKIGNGKVTSEGVDWLRKKIAAMPVLARPTAANWRQWSHMGKCFLWQALALTMDFDPRNFSPRDDGSARGALDIQTWTKISRDDREELGIRLEIVLSNLGEGISDLTPMSKGPRLMTTISLPAFGTWAATKWPDLPKDFPRLGQAVPTASSRWPWGKYETKLLLELAAAAEHFWAREYDPKSPASAPVSEDVIEWLVARKVARRRVAEIMAQILRADGLPAGPRVNKE